MSPADRRGLNVGIVLVGVGAYFLLVRELNLSGPGPILLLIGTLLFVVSALRDFRGPLVPALVLIGLGLGFLLRDPFEPWLPAWATLLLGLGAGLLAAAAILRARGHDDRPAPLIPGVVLVAIAAATALAQNLRLPESLYRTLWRFWPWALLIAGLILVAQSLRRRRSG